MQTDVRLSCRGGASWPPARVGASMAGWGEAASLSVEAWSLPCNRGGRIASPPQGTRQNAGVPLGPAGGGPQEVPAAAGGGTDPGAQKRPQKEQETSLVKGQG